MTISSLPFWTDLLRLPDYDVVFCQEETDLHLLRLTVAPRQRVGFCPFCETLSDTVHSTRTREGIKDLSISKYAVDLQVRVLQFECPSCGQFFTPAIPFLAEGAHATERFLERAAELVRTSDLANAAAFLGIPERTLGDWYYVYLQCRQAASHPKLKPVQRIGIDEIALKKKHRQYACVIVDHDNQRVLEVLENREKATVLAYLQQAKQNGPLRYVVEVTTDMWDAYVEAAKEAFGPAVAITIDRFHVMKNLQECLTGARRELQRELSKAEREPLKGSRWLWLTNPENLTTEELQELKKLKEQYPQLGQLADQREALRAIFDDPKVRGPVEGRQRLLGWLEQAQNLGITALNKFCQTLSRWLDKIANYFRSHGSNGRTEGVNRGVRGLLWRAYGMVNFENFRLRVLHCFG
jgi:transposase